MTLRDYVVLREEAKQTTSRQWTETKLADVCTKIGSGATPRGGKEVYLREGPNALIRSQNVYNTGFKHDGLAFISDEHADALRHVEVFPNDVLLNITGDSVARVCQVDPQVLPARVNQHVTIIRPKPEELDPRFLRYYLAAPGYSGAPLVVGRLGRHSERSYQANDRIICSASTGRSRRTTGHRPHPRHPRRQDRAQPADERDPRADGPGPFQVLVR